MKKGVQQETYNRIELIEGRTVSEAINSMYTVGKFTMVEICAKWGINFRTLMRIFSELHIERKPVSELIANSWVGDTKRKIKCSKKLSEWRNNNPHPLLGATRNDAKERMISDNPMFTPEIKERANKKRNDTYNKEPKRRNIYHNAPTYREGLVIDFFKQCGYSVVGNELIGGRFVDVYLPQIGVSIECVNTARFPLPFDRHQQISNNCKQVIYLTNEFIDKGKLSMVYDYIASLNSFSRFPTFDSKVFMIFGRRSFETALDCNLDKVAFESFTMNGIYLLRATIAP